MFQRSNYSVEKKDNAVLLGKQDELQLGRFITFSVVDAANLCSTSNTVSLAVQ